jgi:hypothetical protein
LSNQGTIPDRASGNLKNLRLCLHAAIDFGAKYQKKGNINFNISFLGKSEDDGGF